ncbi:hypothetical protein EMIHUDRAFT_447697 [Emiliania huxleyi CCMP1516]|uniref:BTB domain-containing protein n=2 Tax=Emiliania huxleyi TaxID=2903 RepID=A0A0D3JH61_EMIH1|nr:hypothetical protein EMIHUDRAFT_447697 [Emiliania huxleyi CCMP1516]EOD22846.1 hypothetical protein EMIHUDRAFT_447697 [Emiliania huxleyi CCMP1516]|eukprot:XP_005775275.1 hypothetical protein EMIHUDRAFT_447697 [Emiliania huxleyi CCMP1516]
MLARLLREREREEQEARERASNLSPGSAALVANLGGYPQRVAHEQNHRRAVQAVQERLVQLEAQLAAVEDEKRQLAADSAHKISALADAARQLLFDHDVMVKSTVDGSQCPARKATLSAASAYFQTRLEATGAELGDDEGVVSLDATREAVRALMLELHLPGCTDCASFGQSLAFEVLELVAMLGGPADSSDLDSSMRKVATLCTNAFVVGRSAERIADPVECAAFCAALTSSIDHVDTLSSDDRHDWLVEAFREVGASCARSIRLAEWDVLKDPTVLSAFSPAALLKVLDAQREGERDGGFVRVRTHRLISVWLSARWAKVPLDPAHAPPLLASEPAPSLEECVFLLRCLANGAPALDSLDALLTGEDIEDIIRKHDELSLQPASNVEFARLWEKLVDGMAYFFGFERSTARWVDAATFSRMLSRKKLKVDSEETVLRAFLDWAEVPGREATVIDQVAPLVRFPLVRVCLPDGAIKDALSRVYRRSPVVKALVQEALALQQEVSRAGEAAACATFRRKRLISAIAAGSADVSADVDRSKKRKLCVNDAVPGVSAADAADALMA